MLKIILKNLRMIARRRTRKFRKGDRYTRETTPPLEKTAKTPQEERLGIDAGIT